MSLLHLLDNTPLVGFYVLGFVAIFASLRVIMLANPVHAILSMIVSLLAIAGIFFVLGAPFAGALQIIVYAGAILVLFVFVIMMLNLGIKSDERESGWLSASVWAVPTGLTVIIAIVLFALVAQGAGVDEAHVAGSVSPAVIGTQSVSPQAVGLALFSQYLLLVEVAALLLLGALVAAYHLGKRALDDENVSHNSQLSFDINESANTGDTDATYDYQPVDAATFKHANLHQSQHLSQQHSQHPSQHPSQHKERL